MASQDVSSLIDWTSPTVEYICKPLIPLPNFDGQPVIDGDNPFDALEKQIDINEPFDMILNQSLNSSSEQIDLDKSIDPKPESRMVDIFDQLNLHSNDLDSRHEPRHSVDDSNVDVSPIQSDTSEVQLLRKRLSTILDKFSKSHDLVATENPVFVPSSAEISGYSWKMHSKDDSGVAANPINKAFIGKNSANDGSFDSVTFNFNDKYEDLSSVSPAWDELVLISSSDEEPDSPVKMPSKNSSLKTKPCAEKMLKKACPRLPLGSKDPNIRARRTTTFAKETGPLKAVIPIESMAKNVNQKLAETPKNTRFARKLKADSTSLKLKRRSAPIATSTPVLQSPSVLSKSKSATKSKPSTPSANSSRSSKLSTPSTAPSRSCPPSPDSTSHSISRPMNKVKVCSRRLALNAVSSSSFNYLSNKNPSKDVKYSSLNSSLKSTVTISNKSVSNS